MKIKLEMEVDATSMKNAMITMRAHRTAPSLIIELTGKNVAAFLDAAEYALNNISEDECKHDWRARPKGKWCATCGKTETNSV